MKASIISFLLLFIPIVISAQEDSTHLKKSEKNKTVIKDSSNKNSLVQPRLPLRSLIIKMKDLPEIKNLDLKHFIIIDDTSNYTPEERGTGLSENELASYKKSKAKLKELIKLPPAEEETYPAIATIRKILGAAKIIGVIIIMILSL